MISPNNNSTPENEQCVVCNEIADGQRHFGVNACRACAAFFRRSVAHDKVYICRDKSRCNIDKSVRCMCKSCRYDKCIRMGMRRTAVQKNRDAIGKRTRPETKENPSTSDDDDLTVAQNMDSLNRISACYDRLMSIRKLIHRNNEELFISRPARLEECNEEDMRDLPHALEFIISSFPEFNALERSQKDILFRNFFLQYGCLECAYWSIVFNRCDVLFTLSGNYIDLNNLDFFFGNIDPVKKKKMIEFMEKTCKTFCDTFLKNAFGLMSDKFEFYTLIGYVIFDIALEGQSDECLAVCKEVRNRLMSELIYYYKNVKKIKNTSGRIAKLMQLPPLVQRASNKFREDVEISHIFGIYIFTESFYDLVFAKEPISNGTIAQAINGISNGIAQSINLNTSNNGYVTGQVNEHGLVQLL